MKFVGTALLSLLPALAFADEIKLNSGRTLVGIAHDEGHRWMVETRHGDIRVPKSEVASVTPARTNLHEYKERLDALTGCPSADEMFELALWAQEEGLIRYVNPLLTRTIELDPDHRRARTMLGFVEYEGQWITASQRNTLVEVQESIQRRAEQRPPEATRRPSRPEEAPYYLGIHLRQPPRSRTAYNPYSGY